MSSKITVTCDRCGKSWVKTYEDDPFHVHMEVDDVALQHSYKEYDLCEKCSDDFRIFMKGVQLDEEQSKEYVRKMRKQIAAEIRKAKRRS